MVRRNMTHKCHVCTRSSVNAINLKGKLIHLCLVHSDEWWSQRDKLVEEALTKFLSQKIKVS